MALLATWLATTAIAQTPAVAACDASQAIPTASVSISADGVLQLPEGPRLRLANIVWPDHLEPQARARLIRTLEAALKDQSVSWKPVVGPDRWGTTPAHLFVREHGIALEPFLLQAGLVEQGYVPLWPDAPSSPCWSDLITAERNAISKRRGYWAPRAQAMRHRVIEADREAHTGRRIVALWRISSVRPWRGLHFINIGQRPRSGPSLSLTGSLVSKLTLAGNNPREWRGGEIVARAVLPPAGLSRLRVESADHIIRLIPEPAPATRQVGEQWPQNKLPKE